MTAAACSSSQEAGSSSLTTFRIEDRLRPGWETGHDFIGVPALGLLIFVDLLNYVR